MFPPFPKISDLLASPAIRPFVDRLQPGPVIAAARGVFDEVHREMKSVATEFRMPDVSELVSRIAERLADQTWYLPRPVLNATGVLFHPECASIPLPSAVLIQMIQHSGLTVDETPLRAMIQQLIEAEDVAILANFISAKMLAAPPGSRLIVARSDVYEETLGDRLVDIHPPSSLIEVGAVNKTTPHDYLRAIEQCSGTETVYFASGAFSAGRFVLEPAEIGLVITAAHERKLRVVVELELSTLVPLVAQGLSAVPVVRDVVAWGADLVVFRGGQLLGGPDVGVIVGRSGAIAGLREHPLYRSLRCDPMAAIGFQATLALYLDKGVALDTAIPVLELLMTSLDNLKNRAHRLVGQFAGCPALASSEVVPGSAVLTASRTLTLPSYQIELVPRQETAEAWTARLARDTTTSLWLRTVPREPASVAVIDLRTVPACSDPQIVELIDKTA